MRQQGQQRKYGQMRWFWTAFAFLILSTAGCKPALLYFLFAPDPMTEPTFTIAKNKKEVSVVILASHAHSWTQTYDLFNADYLLTRKLAESLAKQYKDNGEKVKIVPPHKVQEYKAKHANWDKKTDFQIGQDLKADYVIHLEINKMSLYEKGSTNYTKMYRGNASIFISVTDVNGDEAAGPNSDWYRTIYPRHAPEPADFDGSPGHFRSRFLAHMSQDLTRLFARTPSPTGRNRTIPK